MSWRFNTLEAAMQAAGGLAPVGAIIIVCGLAALLAGAVCAEVGSRASSLLLDANNGDAL